jgi:agmatinase
MSRFLHFADADAELEDARFVILGVPFDATSSYRNGSRFAPNAIREASYNFETYIHAHRVDIADIAIHDAGNLEEYGTVDDMVTDVEAEVTRLISKGAFPLVMGGEHSVTPPVVKALKVASEELGVVVFDAHLDFRQEYLGVMNSHACASRRISDIVGVENMVVIGVRSICKEELDDAGASGLRFFMAEEVHERGIGPVVREAKDILKGRQVHVSVDTDGLDPSFAPGIGNPEPFGLSDRDLREVLKAFAPSMCGFDMVEVCPPFDNGNTAALAARMLREVMALKVKDQM